MIERQTKWDDSFKSGRDYNPMNEILLDLILNQFQDKAKTAIDLGCGTGDAVLKLAQKGIPVTGYDWSQNALDRAKERLETADTPKEMFSFSKLDLNQISKIELPEKSIDIVLCKLVVAFVDDKKSFCEIVKSLLSINGLFIIQTPVLYESVNYTPSDKPEIAVQYKEFKQILEEVFSEVTEFNHSYYGERGDLITFIAK